MSRTTIQRLDPRDMDSIRKIAHWGLEAWNNPVEKTIERLSQSPQKEFLIQLILKKDDILIGTGRLCEKANILNVHPSLEEYSPWISGLFIDHNYRNQGLGTSLLYSLENTALVEGYNYAYLYTYTAEAFYKSMEWYEITRVFYKDHDTVVLGKDLAPIK